MPTAPPSLHVLIADAALARPDEAPTPLPPPLPGLDAVLARLRPQEVIEGADDDPADPVERALARAHGLPDAPGATPWAAFHTGTVGTPCAWLTPCHWQLGMDHVRLLDPAELALDDAESHALLATLQPFLQQDGITLRALRPGAWLAEGEPLRGLRSWSLARASQRPLSREVLSGAAGSDASARLRRLQNEWQMLLHGHPVNEARAAARRWPVNALWIDGAGVLERPTPPRADVWLERRLAPHAAPDLHARQAAWAALDAEWAPRLRAVLDAGGDARLTLGGPRRAVTWHAAAPGPLRWISRLFRSESLSKLVSSL